MPPFRRTGSATFCAYSALLNRYDYEPPRCTDIRARMRAHPDPVDLRTAEGLAKYRGFVEDAARLVVEYGGSLSGWHGNDNPAAVCCHHIR